MPLASRRLRLLSVFAPSDRVQRAQDPGQERLQIGEAIRAGRENDTRDATRRQILPIRQPSVDRQENFEALLCQVEREFEFVADVLGVAPLGASSGDGGYFPVSSHEYLSIPGDRLELRDGRDEIRITEELHEVSYIDQVRLIALDHPAGVDIVTNEKFKSPPFPEFRLYGVSRRILPVSARDGQGRDVLAKVLRRDRVYADGFRHDMAGVAEMHSLELDFGLGAARDNRAVLMLSGWIDWADGSTFMAASQGSKDGLVLPYLQVKDAAGQWRTVIEDMGVPAGEPRTIAVDLTGKFLSASRAVRIVTNTCVYWDQIYLSEDTAAPRTRMTAMDAQTADLTLRGFSRAVVDARHWSKDADANTAFGDSVEPLPFHGMSQYPYPAAERFPDDEAHRQWRKEYNVRRPVNFIQPLVARQ